MTRPESRSALFLGLAPAGPRLRGRRPRQVSAVREGRRKEGGGSERGKSQGGLGPGAPPRGQVRRGSRSD